MTESAESETFKSWRQALDAGRLPPGQLAVLEDMVAQGEADSVQSAADRLDWQDHVLQPDEHMWGF